MKDNSQVILDMGGNIHRKLLWEDPVNQYKYSHYAILNKINPETDHVIDVGCGTNPFYGKIKNLVAIDPVHCDTTNPYTLISIEDFETDQKFDVALCLGSIQYGTHAEISIQIKKIVSMLKPTAKIFWRFRWSYPGWLNAGTYSYNYPMTVSRLQEFAGLHGFTQQEIHKDVNLRGQRPRTYAEWVRVGQLADE